jgi:c(7)-type cytochrome triheme protein
MTKMWDRQAQEYTPTDSPGVKQSRAGRRRGVPLAVFVIGCAGFILAAVYDSRVSAVSARHAPTAEQAAGGDSIAFTHNNSAHQRLPCLLCHRRETTARPPRPGHTPCSGCHAQQFAASSGPICSICHTDVGSARPKVKPFPNIKSFNMKFDHSRHQGVDCSRCHKPASRGVALSIPTGFNAHTTCYQCHAPRAQAAGRDISSCGTCHKPGRLSRTPVFTKAYKVSFSHARHSSQQNLSCQDCHSVRAGAAQSRQVTSPAPVQHFGSASAASCMTCHNNQRAFGGDDFSDCKRCHSGATFKF